MLALSGLLFSQLLVVRSVLAKLFASENGDFSSKPYCTVENLRVEQINGQSASWYLQHDGTFRLAFHHCRLRSFSGIEAKMCLANNHILFMGDSLSRYFYLSLAVLMATNQWAPKFTHSTDTKYPPSMLSEGDFGSWSDFYHYTNSIINDPSTSSHELCDCFRDDTVSKFPAVYLKFSCLFVDFLVRLCCGINLVSLHLLRLL